MDRWDDWDDGKSTWVTSALMFVVAVIVLMLFGCAPRYTVVAADREVVPVAPCEDGKFKVTEEGATGWYVPDSIMLDLLEAD